MLKRRFNMRKNSAGEWRRQKAVVMHGVEPFVLVGEEETASCLCGLLLRTIFVNDRVIIFVIEGFSISTELFREAHMK
jgi:hypothetical protein